MKERDRSLLEDMLEHARHALELGAGFDARTLASDMKTRLAVSHAIQIVGEAANHVSEDAKANLPQVPWKQIVGARHILVHDYGRIDLTVIAQVVRLHLPQLVETLQQLVDENTP